MNCAKMSWTNKKQQGDKFCPKALMSLLNTLQPN